MGAGQGAGNTGRLAAWQVQHEARLCGIEWQGAAADGLGRREIEPAASCELELGNIIIACTRDDVDDTDDGNAASPWPEFCHSFLSSAVASAVSTCLPYTVSTLHAAVIWLAITIGQQAMGQVKNRHAMGQ